MEQPRFNIHSLSMDDLSEDQKKIFLGTLESKQEQLFDTAKNADISEEDDLKNLIDCNDKNGVTPLMIAGSIGFCTLSFTISFPANLGNIEVEKPVLSYHD
jgi:hypothetical protein